MNKPIICQYFGCDKPATVKIVRASTVVCDDHYIANVLRFGGTFTTTPVKQPTKEIAQEPKP